MTDDQDAPRVVCPKPGWHTHHLSPAGKVALRLPTGVPWRFVLRHRLATWECPAEKARRLDSQCPPAEHGHLTAVGQLHHPRTPDRRGRLFAAARGLRLTNRTCPRSPR